MLKHSNATHIIISWDLLSKGANRITISDNSTIKLDAERMNRFFQFDPNIKFSGLGLYIIRDLIHHYNSRISIANTESHGHSFELTFPLP